MLKVYGLIAWLYKKNMVELLKVYALVYHKYVNVHLYENKKKNTWF